MEKVLVQYIIIISCLTSLDSSKPIRKKIYVNHGATYNYIVVIIVAGMKMHTPKEVHWRITKTPK